jgi:hypothetical protein
MRNIMISLAVLAVLVIAALLLLPRCSAYLDCCDECVTDCITPPCKHELGTYNCTNKCREVCANSCEDQIRD